jgi:hypothetical protein
MKKVSSVFVSAVLCLNTAVVANVKSQTVDEQLLNKSNNIFNWAEKNYYQLFSNQESIFASNSNTIVNVNGWIYRYYSKLDNYIGVNLNGNDLYIAGKSFANNTSNPFKVLSMTQALALASADLSYADKVGISGSALPYTLLRGDLNNGNLEIRNGGFGSAAAAHPTQGNRFYALTDRGPNSSFTGVDGKGKIFPTPDYTPRIGLFELNSDGQIVLIKEILLKDTNGNAITGLPNSSSLGGTGETPYDAAGNTIRDEQGNIKLDNFGLDGEGLAALQDGTFWVSDEYGPHIVHYDADGKEIGRINPFRDDTRTMINLPAEFANRRANRGMEGLTITPDQTTLVGIMQSTIYNPSSAVKNLDITRIVTINLNNGHIGQYLYKQDKTQNSNSEIMALSNNDFLVIERDGSFLNGGSKSASPEAQKLVYKIDISTGTDLEKIQLTEGLFQDDALGLTIDEQTLEEFVLTKGWPALESKGIRPVQKAKIADLVKEVAYPHDKMEGLWVIDSNTLGILNDDDFATWSTDGVLEQKYINAEKTQIDGNMLYIVNGLNLSEKIKKIATYKSGIFDESSAEIVTFDSLSKKFFVTNASTNSIDVLQLENQTLSKIISIDLSTYGGGVNSVSAYNGVIAVAVQANNKQSNGSIEFFSHEGTHLNSFAAGPLPDMVTFSKDGKIVISANEGEPSNDYKNDPKGSITIVDTEKQSATTIDFTNVVIPSSGMKFFNIDKASDIEPEYIAINDSGTKAYVTLQENNGVAIIDLASKTIEKIVALGFKDFSLVGNEIDANKNNQVSLINVNAFGMYQPDSIAVYTVNGEDYFVTANEGDDREYDAYEEETKVSKLTLDPSLDTTGLSDTVRVTPELGDTDGDGDYDQLYMMGARSFSIWNSSGKLVFDSGSQLQRHVINAVGEQHFNTRVDDTRDTDDIAKMTAEGIKFSLKSDTAYFFEGRDARSEKKGLEPEALTLGTIEGNTYAFIGLEKQGGFFMYDITNPIAPKFVKYQNTVDYTQAPANAGDLGPEGMKFVPADQSPNGKNLLVVANEISGTTSVYEISK